MESAVQSLVSQGGRMSRRELSLQVAPSSSRFISTAPGLREKEKALSKEELHQAGLSPRRTRFT